MRERVLESLKRWYKTREMSFVGRLAFFSHSGASQLTKGYRERFSVERILDP